MTEQVILKKIHSLPENMKGEVLDFIDFLVQKYRLSQTEKKIIPAYGSLKGTFKMADDFDEPLDEFNEYST